MKHYTIISLLFTVLCTGCSTMQFFGRLLDMLVIDLVTNGNVANECYFSKTVWHDFDWSKDGNEIVFEYWPHLNERHDIVFYSERRACSFGGEVANTLPTGRVEVVVKQLGKVIYSGIEDLEASYKRGMPLPHSDLTWHVGTGCFPISYLPKSSFKREEKLEITLKMITPVPSRMKELMGRIAVKVEPDFPL